MHVDAAGQFPTAGHGAEDVDPRAGVLGYSGSMFDVLVYLYENYWRPDACPSHDQLARKLTAVGFESDEIQEALTWLDGLAQAAESYTGRQSEHGLRVYSSAE